MVIQSLFYCTHMFVQTQLIELRTTNYQLKEEQQKLISGELHTTLLVIHNAFMYNLIH